VKNTIKNVRNLQVAHIALTKLKDNNNDVTAAKLGVHELKDVVQSLGKKSPTLIEILRKITWDFRGFEGIL
jgi:hypothetical protein